MFGCDLVGQLCGYLHLKTRASKWTQTILLTKLRQAVAVQGWVIFNLVLEKEISVLDFTSKLIEEMITFLKTKSQKRQRSPTTAQNLQVPPPRKKVCPPPLNIPLNFDHYPVKRAITKREKGKRCCQDGNCPCFHCSKPTQIFCEGCWVHLCIPQVRENKRNCFKEFHLRLFFFSLVLFVFHVLIIFPQILEVFIFILFYFIHYLFI